MNRSTPILSILMVLVGSLPAPAEDTVVLRSGNGRQTRLRGRVVDYDQQQLRLQLSNGPEQVIPAERVLRVETPYTAEQIQADQARDKAQHDAALVLYQKALALERRRWARRAIVREMIWCHRASGQVEQAGELFLLLARDRPSASDFACMPLAWSGWPPSASLERAARGWMARADLPAAALLGASHLLSTEPAAAAARLKRLAINVDGPVAQLAAAQLWRTEALTADAPRTAAWRRAIDRMPEPLRAGPYFVLGRALARQGQLDEAALVLLRAPILYPRQVPLSADALVEAARVLEKRKRPRQAARLYREVIRDHPSLPAASEARAQWEAMTREQIK